MFSIAFFTSCTKYYCVDCEEYSTGMEIERCGMKSDEADAYIYDMANSGSSTVWFCFKTLEN